MENQTESCLLALNSLCAEEWINRKPSGITSVSPLPATLLVLLYYFIKCKSCQCHSTHRPVQPCHFTLSRLNYNLII